MITYDWNCKTVDTYLERDNNIDVVYNVHYRVTGTKINEGEEYSYTNIGTQELQVQNIEDFTPFNEITHEDLIAWTKSALGEDAVSQIQDSLLASVDLLITPEKRTITIE